MSNSFSLASLARLLKGSNANNSLEIDSSGNPIAVTPYKSSNLTNLLYPSVDGGWRDILRSGWVPAFFNQQWGGAQWGGLPDGSFGDIATGQIQDDTNTNVGGNTANIYESQGFELSESMTNPVIWVKLLKGGNPVDNTVLSIYSDNGSGSPNAIIGTSASMSSKLITSNINGEWYAFQPSPGLLSAGTKYHIVLSKSAGFDGTNYPYWKATSRPQYPYGTANNGTSTPVWTKQTFAFCFLVQNVSTTQVLQNNGKFNGLISINQGNPLNQSRALRNELRNFWDAKSGTFLIRGQGWNKGVPIADFQYGIDHERVLVMCDATTGYASIHVYDETGNVYSVTGTSDVSTGFHDIGFKIRTMGDGADYVHLYVDGVEQGVPLTATTISMSYDIRDLGCATIGGGIGLPPAWNLNQTFLALPSTTGWTWTGTATEANAMSVSGGKLYQNKNGYAATDTGYYTRTTALNNATGWCVVFKGRVPSSPNTDVGSSYWINIQDGTKLFSLVVNEYFLDTWNVSTADAYIQGDFKSQEHVFVIHGRGSDYYLYIDGKLAVDGTGKLVSTTATNAISFGDGAASSGVNSDGIWSYVKYYQGWAGPTFASGAQVHEAAYWSGDKSALFAPAYNSGTQISIKNLCGVEKNYVSQVSYNEYRHGAIYSPTTTSTSPVLLTDMEAYVLGSDFDISTVMFGNNNTTGATITLYVSTDGGNLSDGANGQPIDFNSFTSYSGGVSGNLQLHVKRKAALGLHKIETRWNVGSGTATANWQARNLKVKSEV